MGVGAMGEREPLARAAVRVVVTPAQLSVPTGVVYVPTAPDGQVGSSTMLLGQLITGGVLSMTVTNWLAVAALLSTSFAVQTTVVVPTGNVLPEGLRVIVTAEQLSLAVAVPSVASLTTVSQVLAPAPVKAVTVGGTKVNIGGVVSLTVNVTLMVVVLPAPSLLLEPSFAVSVIVCGPSPTNVPAAGLCVTVMSCRLSQICEVSELAHAQLSDTTARVA